MRLVAEGIGDPRDAVARALKFDLVSGARHHREEAEAVHDARRREETRGREVGEEEHRGGRDHVGRQHDGGEDGGQAPSPVRSRRRLQRARASVFDQQDAEGQHEVIEERVVRGDDDADLQQRGDDEESNAHAPRRNEHQPNEEQLGEQSERGGRGVERMRQLLRVPADERRQRAVLVVLVHRGQIAPLLFAAEEIHQSRLEVDAEPLVSQHEHGCVRRWLPFRAEKEREERGLEQHAVRLI